MTERQVTIYALCDPDTNEVRYIGQSVDPDTGIKAHIGTSFTGTTKRDNWIRGLLVNGKHPKLKVLNTVSVTEADQAEVGAIKQAKRDGCNLVNGHESATGGLAKTKLRPLPEKVEITFKVSRYTLDMIEKIAPAYGGKNALLSILVDRARR